MKIDENCINHNVTRIVSEMTEELYSYCDDEKIVASTLAEIRGVCTLAHDLKVVLKS